ncbi:MAG TPA: NEW3 domain-containing protein [Longimicrobiales bacterium]
MIARVAIALLLSAGSLSAQGVGPVGAQGPPRSVQVVRVPIPDVLRGAASVSYSASAVSGFHVIGRGTGSVHGALDALITIGVPASAVAGTHTAARVLFSAGGREVQVSIEMTVTPVHQLHLDAPAELTALRAGERFEIAYKVQNRGNTTDTVRMGLELPPGWRKVATDSQRIIIAPFSSAEGKYRITVPRSSSTGNFFVRMAATSRGARAAALSTLTVGPAFNQSRLLGAALRASAGSVAMEGGRVETVPQFALTGPLTSNIQVDGRLTIAPDLSAPLVRGLATVGTYVTDPHLVAWNPRWRATLGSTVLAMTDLTGVNAGGRGFGFEYYDTSRVFSVVAAGSRANSPGSGGDGELYGAHFEHNLRHLRVGATATQLRGIGLHEHELTSFGVQARSYPIRTLTFGGETAYRRFLDGSGMGWTARVRHDRADDHAEIQVTHAPGGSEAYARAENEVFLSFVKDLNKRLELAGTFVDARDESRTSYAFHARSAAFTPSYLVSAMLRIRADVRHSAFDVDATPIGYGNAETHFSLGGGGAWRWLGYSTDLGIARLARSVNAADIDATERGTRLTWRMNLSRATQLGVFQLEGNYERNSEATGYLPQQYLVGLRADRVQVPAISDRLELDAEVTVQSWTGVSTTPVLRAGAQYVLPHATVALGVERNPLLTGLGQRTPWIFALKLERSLGLPRIMTGRATGIVYRDFNGNGRQDAGEPGIANVAVRRGALRVLSAQDGAYRFWEQGRGAVTVDPATLPYGWIVGHSENGNIGLVATTRLLVTLELGAAERLRNLDVSGVAVIARDAQGREWTARRTSNEQAVFEALPVGRYTIDADFSALAEPLRVTSEVTVDVVENELAQAKLPVSGRPLRFRQN